MPEVPIVQVRVQGPWACFTRPEMKVERVSYPVMTPSAARGVLDAILWKPQFRWVVLRIDVLAPIRLQSVQRNEVKKKVAVGGDRGVAAWMKDSTKFQPLYAGAGSDDATPRTTLALRDVSYVIHARPHVYQVTVDDHPIKYVAMFQRRVEAGQCFHRPYLGCREFACDFCPATGAETRIEDNQEIGRMLYDIVYRDASNRPVFFDARLEHGTLVTDPWVVFANDPTTREAVLLCSSRP